MKKYREFPLEEILKLYRDSYNRSRETIRELPEETLFTPGLDPWINKNTLATTFKSSTSSHYTRVLKEVKKGFRALEK